MLHVKFGATYSTLNRHPPDRPYRGAMALEDMVISAAHGLHNGARALGAMLGRASASPVAAELKSQDWFSVNALGRLLKRPSLASWRTRSPLSLHAKLCHHDRAWRVGPVHRCHCCAITVCAGGPLVLNHHCVITVPSLCHHCAVAVSSFTV